MHCLIVLPTYNERENLRPIIEGIQQHAPLAHVVIVDDESPDGTGELADELVELAAHRCMEAGFSASRQSRQSLLYRRDWTVGLVEMKRPGVGD